MRDLDATWNQPARRPEGRWRRISAALPMRSALIAVGVVWLLGCVWSYQEQSAFAASKGFTFPHLLPLVIDGFAVSMAGVAWAASLDARPAVPARLATVLAVGASSASNGVWAYLRANHDTVTVVLGIAVPVAANLAFEVLLAELRRQVQRRRGLPPPVAVPYPRLIRIALAPWQTFRDWRSMVLELTAVDHATADYSRPSRSAGPSGPAGATVPAGRASELVGQQGSSGQPVSYGQLDSFVKPVSSGVAGRAVPSGAADSAMPPAPRTELIHPGAPHPTVPVADPVPAASRPATAAPPAPAAASAAAIPVAAAASTPATYAPAPEPTPHAGPISAGPISAGPLPGGPLPARSAPTTSAPTTSAPTTSAPSSSAPAPTTAAPGTPAPGMANPDPTRITGPRPPAVPAHTGNGHAAAYPAVDRYAGPTGASGTEQPRQPVNADPVTGPAAPFSPAPATNGRNGRGPTGERPATRHAPDGPAASTSVGVGPTGPTAAGERRTSREERRPLDPRVVRLAQHLARSGDTEELTGEMVSRLLDIDVAPRTGRRLLGQARELVNRRAEADAHGIDDPELSVIGGR